MSNTFRFVFLSAVGICLILFINEREIPTNGVLDVCYPHLGEQLFGPAYGDTRSYHPLSM